jgi:hypothetical protein
MHKARPATWTRVKDRPRAPRSPRARTSAAEMRQRHQPSIAHPTRTLRAQRSPLLRSMEAVRERRLSDRAPGLAQLDSIRRGTPGQDCAMHVHGLPTARLLPEQMAERIAAVSSLDSTESALWRSPLTHLGECSEGRMLSAMRHPPASTPTARASAGGDCRISESDLGRECSRLCVRGWQSRWWLRHCARRGSAGASRTAAAAGRERSVQMGGA